MISIFNILIITVPISITITFIIAVFLWEVDPPYMQEASFSLASEHRGLEF